jgi:rubredoxin
VTTRRETEWTCPVCGEPSRQTEVMSTNQLEPPDFDLRPGEMKRSTLPYLAWRCPGCGYVEDSGAAGWRPVMPEPDHAPRLDDVFRVVIEGREYRRQLSDSLPELANAFLCRALLDEEASRPAAAGWWALRAAWVCDDAGDADAARRCRERALELWEAAVAAGERLVRGNGLAPRQLVLADVFRRAGRFDRARECCHRALSGRPRDPIRSLLEFEMLLITREDVEAHSTGEVVGRR